jgi:hypothetical protein
MVIVIVTYEAKATAGRALTFVVRIFVNDTIAIAVWTSFDTITVAVWISFHLCVPLGRVLIKTSAEPLQGVSALPPKADLRRPAQRVCYGP